MVYFIMFWNKNNSEASSAVASQLSSLKSTLDKDISSLREEFHKEVKGLKQMITIVVISSNAVLGGNGSELIESLLPVRNEQDGYYNGQPSLVVNKNKQEVISDVNHY